jgi:hypothetical protein
MPDPATNIKVTAHYIAAAKPYKADVPPAETLATLKTNVLNFFELVEEGNKTYKLFLHKNELTNMAETVGQVAGDKKELNLDLEEFIIQGR